jgi:hypothetical protein
LQFKQILKSAIMTTTHGISTQQVTFFWSYRVINFDATDDPNTRRKGHNMFYVAPPIDPPEMFVEGNFKVWGGQNVDTLEYYNDFVDYHAGWCYFILAI